MIYTVTLNPALDRAILVEKLNDDDTNRIINETFYAAGKGIEFILVSMGKKGLIFSSKDRKMEAVAPPAEVESSVGANGSAVVWFVLVHSRGRGITECVRLACAAGTETAKTPGTELCNPEDVKKILEEVKITFF